MCDRLFQLGSAGIFAALLGVDYFTAFYHCWITATTGEHLTVIYLVLLHNDCLLITYLWCCPHSRLRRRWDRHAGRTRLRDLPHAGVRLLAHLACREVLGLADEAQDATGASVIRGAIGTAFQHLFWLLGLLIVFQPST